MKPSRLPMPLVLLLGAAMTASAASLRLETTTRPTEWTLYHGGQKVLVYAFDPAKYKSYVKELCTLKGYNILRDAPFDHLHHHALMYGIKVNGLNFWEEAPGAGVTKAAETRRPEFSVTAGGLPQARIVQVLHWVAPQDAFVPDSSRLTLLVERRTLTLTIDEAAQEVALQWAAEFQVGAKTNQVTLTGANYHGLGVRFLQELDPLAEHLNGGGRPDLTGNKQDVSLHKWGAVRFDVSGHQATLAIFGHPSNTRGDARFFTMRTPFAYLSATQGLDREPLVYRQGERFALRYLVVLYPDLKSADFLSNRSRHWEAAEP